VCDVVEVKNVKVWSDHPQDSPIPHVRRRSRFEPWPLGAIEVPVNRTLVVVTLLAACSGGPGRLSAPEIAAKLGRAERSVRRVRERVRKRLERMRLAD